MHEKLRADSSPPAEKVRATCEQEEIDAKILIAKDNPSNHAVVVGMLEACMCRTTVVDNGSTAVQVWQEGEFDLVLMDVHMPKMDGLSAAAEIRRLEKEQGKTKIPIIAITADAMEGDRERCLAAGMDDYLSKPFRQSQLRGLLGRWIPAGLQATGPATSTSSPTRSDSVAHSTQ